MGKRKVTDKDIRSIEFAIDSVFIGSSEKAAKQALHSLVEQADEAGKLQNDLDSLRHEFNTLGPYTKRWLFVSGVNLDGELVKQPVMAKWMTRVPRKAEEK